MIFVEVASSSKRCSGVCVGENLQHIRENAGGRAEVPDNLGVTAVVM